MLRKCHDNTIHGDINLVPWILQFNIAIRRQSEYGGECYRGATLDENDIKKYQKGKLFVWAPFISSSKSEETCLGGNVIFKIHPAGAYSMHDKRNGREIFQLSVFPDEEEIIFPMACACRVTEIEKSSFETYISLETVDWN